MISVKKIILLLFFIPLICFGQKEPNKKNGLDDLLKKAEKLVGKIGLDSDKGKDQKLENRIVSLWKDYNKAFEYKDYEKIASFFTYPSTLGISSNPRLFNNKNELISIYKIIREEKIQKGYKYSLLDAYELIKFSDDLCLLKASFSRFDSNYMKLFSGEALYFFKKINTDWKIYSLDPLSKID